MPTTGNPNARQGTEGARSPRSTPSAVYCLRGLANATVAANAGSPEVDPCDKISQTSNPALTKRLHWMRVELGMILMKFAFEISVQLWSPL